MKRSWLPAFLIVALLVIFRLIGAASSSDLPNFQPLPAMLLCSWVLLRGRQRWLVPLLAWFLTDPFVSLLQGYNVFGWHHLSVIAGLIATWGIAVLARRRPSSAAMLTSALLTALAFHFITNLIAFGVDPRYAKTLTGFAQAQWTGPAGMMPTWVFFRNLAMANFLFTAVFLFARKSLPASEPSTSHALAR